jgi:transitional endoplasmic reticulum ATPase
MELTARPMLPDASSVLSLIVADAPPADSGQGIVRLDPDAMEGLGVQARDVVCIEGKRRTYATVLRAFTSEHGLNLVQIDEVGRLNCRAAINARVQVRRAEAAPAEELVLVPLRPGGLRRDNQGPQLLRHLQQRVVTAGDRVRVERPGASTLELLVEQTRPEGPAVVGTETQIVLRPPGASGERGGVTYADVGGLREPLARLREVVEAPLKHPALIERLGIEPPRGVLLFGPPGGGKTLLARAVANETSAHFVHVSGPEVFHRHYGESEAHLREIFQEAKENPPAIIFLDEIDAIAPRREDVTGGTEKRVVAQLMALMDGLEPRGQVVVIAATNVPDALDEALRRPGRFDREIAIPVPDAEGRREILAIHTRRMPLAADVDLDSLASATHGFTGADLRALCQEAAMRALRDILESARGGEEASDGVAERLQVGREHFLVAKGGIRPSALRDREGPAGGVRWADIGGLEAAKRTLRETVLWPLQQPEVFRRAGAAPVRGILLSGPPGSGKTLLAGALATEADVNFVYVKGPALYSKWVGESERAVRELFYKAHVSRPCILFIDELDALAPARGGAADSGVAERVVAQLLSELDGLHHREGVVVLAATNRSDLVDPALLRPGRFDTVIALSLPDREDRRQIFTVLLRASPLAPDVDPSELADLTEGMSGGQIAAICRRATLLAIGAYVERRAPNDLASLVVTADHLRQALAEIRGAGAPRG